MFIFGGVTVLDEHRTNSVYRTWLEVPALRDLCWTNISETLIDVPNCDIDNLLNLGIPAHYVTSELYGFRSQTEIADSCG